MTEPTTTTMSVSTQGGITLAMYVNLLTSAAQARLPRVRDVDSSDVRNRAIRELLKEGLLSDDRWETGTGRVLMTGPLALTPSGASALVQWTDYLSSRTLRARMLALLGQAFLVAVGAGAASVPEILAAL